MYLIYKITNPTTYLSYIGLTQNLESRISDHKEQNTLDCKDFHVEILSQNISSRKDAFDLEKTLIETHDTFNNGANQNKGGAGSNKHTNETIEKIRNASILTNRKRVKDGTHNFLDSKKASEQNRKRVKDGTHNLLGDSNPNHKLIAEDNHHFLDSEWQKENNPSKKLIKEGTHHFTDPEWQHKNNQKLIERGIHNFVGDSNPITKLSKEGRHPRTIKRLKGQWMYIRSLAMYWDIIHPYITKLRTEFYDQSIPDTSNSEQLTFF